MVGYILTNVSGYKLLQAPHSTPLGLSHQLSLRQIRISIISFVFGCFQASELQHAFVTMLYYIANCSLFNFLTRTLFWIVNKADACFAVKEGIFCMLHAVINSEARYLRHCSTAAHVCTAISSVITLINYRQTAQTFSPGGPAKPLNPVAPKGPGNPGDPLGPGAPTEPGGPGKPGEPRNPGEPDGPGGPVAPCPPGPPENISTQIS